MIKVLTIENLRSYHESLIKYLRNPHLVATNICPQCGAVINDINECEYCGAKLKLVVDE